jgi:hypothetical protein
MTQALWIDKHFQKPAEHNPTHDLKGGSNKIDITLSTYPLGSGIKPPDDLPDLTNADPYLRKRKVQKHRY